MPKILSILLSLSLLSCSSDIGVTHVTEEKIIGEFAVDGGIIYDQAVDILFVVDESGSMIDDQDRLSATMPEIYDVLMGPDFIDLKWRVGITSTDATSGIYCGGDSSDLSNCYVEHNDPSADIKLLMLTSLLETHSQEAGLDSVISSIAWDSWFYREDADLLLVYISDEPDQSLVSVATYEQITSRLKKDPFMVTESSIVTTGDWTNDANCTSWAEGIGTGYLEVSEITIDLCDTSNWIMVMDNVINHVPTLNKYWPLSEQTIDPASIEVFVNNEEYSHFVYDSDTNTVELTRLPETGSTVTIVYLVSSGP